MGVIYIDMGHVKSNSPKSSSGYEIKSAASTGVAIASGLKTAYDIGKTVYNVDQTASPSHKSWALSVVGYQSIILKMLGIKQSKQHIRKTIANTRHMANKAHR